MAVSLTGLAAYAPAEGIDDPRRADYFKDLSGKTIAFVPVTMGIDLTEGWASVMKQQADRLGMKFEIRDPHFSADAGAQAITSLIAEKPDVIVVHNPDIQSYAKLLKRAEEAGIHVIQINMRSNYNSDVYVGADWIGIGEAEAKGCYRQVRRRHERQGRYFAGPADFRVGQRDDEGGGERLLQTSGDQDGRQCRWRMGRDQSARRRSRPSSSKIRISAESSDSGT